jgi:hypothetical protein
MPGSAPVAAALDVGAVVAVCVAVGVEPVDVGGFDFVA